MSEQPETVPEQTYEPAETGTSVTPTTDPTAVLDADSPALTGEPSDS